MIAKYYYPRRKAGSPPGPPELLLKMAMITDTHFRAGVDGDPAAPGAIGGSRMYYASNSKMRNFVELFSEGDYDLAIHGGDACDSPSDWPFFVDEWANIPIPKVFLLGNHDMDDGYESVIAATGYDERPVVAGSHFNETFVVNDTRIIVLDCQYDVTDPSIHTNGSRSRPSAAGIDWLQTVLSSISEEIAVIFSHNIPHYFEYPSPSNPYFPVDVAGKVAGAVSAAKAVNPTFKRAVWFGGHAHTVEHIAYNNIPHCTGHRMPDSIEYWNSDINSVNGFSDVEIYSDGSVIVTGSQLSYPFP